MNKFNIDVSKLECIRTKKITFNGVTEDRKVYRVPLDVLFYNDLNGRIATFISQYESDGKRIVDLNNEEYNNLLAEFIKNSATPKRFNKTKEDIRLNTQKEVGAVLTDGRIIDGNRRFTCLRELFNESGGDMRYGFFEAVVLPAPDEDDEKGWKAVRSLELETQHGTDEKVDYDPIDWLASVYRDLVKTKTYTEAEYVRILKITPSDFKKLKAKAEIMGDFLEFFDKKEQFYVAKDLELDGPISELVGLRRRLEKDPREWNRIKVVFYVFMWSVRKGDRPRLLRKIVKGYGTPEFENLINKAQKEAEKILYGKTDETNSNSFSDSTKVIDTLVDKKPEVNTPSFSDETKKFVDE